MKMIKHQTNCYHFYSWLFPKRNSSNAIMTFMTIKFAVNLSYLLLICPVSALLIDEFNTGHSTHWQTQWIFTEFYFL